MQTNICIVIVYAIYNIMQMMQKMGLEVVVDADKYLHCDSVRNLRYYAYDAKKWDKKL